MRARESATAPASGRWFALMLLMLVTALPVVAQAKGVDNVKAAVSMSQKAAQAYQSGDYRLAGELYSAAFRSDPLSAYLYGAARAEQLAGMTSEAAAHFQQYIDAGAGDPARLERARAALTEIQAARVADRAREAEKSVRAGDFKLGGRIYLDAWRLAPNRVDLLFRAAVAEQSGEEFAAARQHLESYLAKAPANAADRSEATARLETVEARLRLTLPVGPGAETSLPSRVGQPSIPMVKAAPESPGWRGWALVGSGAALGLGGLGVYLATRADIDAYDKATTPVPGQKVTAIAYDEAQSRASSIRSREGLAWALGGVGLALCGVGVWMQTREGDKARVAKGLLDVRVSWAPGPVAAGSSVAVRF